MLEHQKKSSYTYLGQLHHPCTVSFGLSKERSKCADNLSALPIKTDKIHTIHSITQKNLLTESM